jgi:ferric-dicitrate binding protein FerR (iron transport regulator)
MEQGKINDLDILITKYLENKCTKEEKNQLLGLLSSYDNGRSTKEVLFSQLNEFREVQSEDHSVDFERIYMELVSEIIGEETKESERQILQKRIKVKRLLLQGISAAAVICIAFLLGSVFSRPRNLVTPVQPVLSSMYNEIKAPLGATSEIKLNDGTEIMLNAGSSIKYRSDFNLLHRDLVLEGEAYFKVAKNMNLPLVVNAGNINIKATGTEFNVKAYSDEGIIETTLVNGEVEIYQQGNKDKERILVLKPNQKAIYAEQSDQLTLEKIKEIEPQAIKTAKISTKDLMVSSKTDVEQVTAWTKNKLIIRSENLESLCIKLERKYDVTFIFRDEEIKKHRFSGVLLDETLQQVMDVIKLTAPVDYLIDRKTVLLFTKNEKTEKYSTDLNTVKN